MIALRGISIGAAVLALLVSNPATGCRKESRTIQAQRNVFAMLGMALDSYYLDVGEYPQSLSGLLRNPGNSNWEGPYCVNKTVPSDPWGMPLQYRATPNSYILRSSGPDLVTGTNDDISVGQTNNVPPRQRDSHTREAGAAGSSRSRSGT